MSVRLRRLYAEHERLKLLFADHPRIRVAEAFGDPPDRYVIEYRMRGMTETKEGVRESHLHRIQITLGPNYPNEMPACSVIGAPVFHPNIDHLAVCTADVSSASRTLDQTIVFIGELITFQAYNLQSPRNGEAKKWTEENLNLLPLERVELLPRMLLEGASLPIPNSADLSAYTKCTNCGREGFALKKCSNGHIICGDCTFFCANCGRHACVACAVHTCQECRRQVCSDCGVICPGCSRTVCAEHAWQCPLCSAIRCKNCGTYCTGCGTRFCKDHLEHNARCPRCAGDSRAAFGAESGTTV